MTQREIAELIRALGMMWPTVPVRDIEGTIQVRIWHQVLADVSYDEALTVVIEHARTGNPFPPAVGVIAERVLTARERAAGTYAPDPDQALAEVMAGIRQGGQSLLDPKRQPRHVWSHPAVAGTVRAMGWRDMCLSEKPDVVRAQFLRVYADAAARHRERARRTPAMNQLLAAGRATAELNSPSTTTGEPDEPAEHPTRQARRNTGRASLAAVPDDHPTPGPPHATAG